MIISLSWGHTGIISAMVLDTPSPGIRSKGRGIKRKDIEGLSISDSAEEKVTEGVELLLQDLSMKDSKDNKKFSEVERKIHINDKEQLENQKGNKSSRIEIGSSSRVTRSHTRNVINLDAPSSHFSYEQNIKGECSTKVEAPEKNTEEENPLDDDIQEQDNTRIGVDVLRTRTSPHTLHSTIIGLTTQQREAVKELGLESLLAMKVDGVPSKLGYYVVDNLDIGAMVLTIRNDIIPITVESVHKILGLPIRGIDLLGEDDVDMKMNITHEWRAKLKKKNIRPNDVKTYILETTDDGFMFKVSFLVLFVNLMCECNSMGTCNLQFLAKIRNEDMMSKIDWCKFMYDKVRGSILYWRRDNAMCFYTGPLTYLTLLYVHSTFSTRVEVEKGSPPSSVWDLLQLKKRQTTELEDDGFSLLPLASKVTEADARSHIDDTDHPLDANSSEHNTIYS